MLREKKTYIEIGEVTGASTATISRVNRCLNYGSNGYNTILDRLEVEEKSNKNTALFCYFKLSICFFKSNISL